MAVCCLINLLLFFAFALHLGPPLQLHPGLPHVRALDTEINITRIFIAVPYIVLGYLGDYK